MISPNDPDLEAYEKYISNFHQQLSRLKVGAYPSYENPKFYEDALSVDYLPGNDDGYCLFAASLFCDAHLHNYKLDAHLMLEKSYGKKSDESVNCISTDFLQLEANSLLLKELKVISQKCCILWDYIIFDHLSNPLAEITEECVGDIIEKSDQIGDSLIELSRHEEMKLGELKKLSRSAKYDWLAKATLQIYDVALPKHTKLLTQMCTDKLGDELIGGDHKILKVVDLILTHRLALKSDRAAERKKARKEMLQLPAEYIYVKLNGNKKADSTKAAYRWLFIKTWAYSFLKCHPMSLSDLARVIANDDRFFYRDNMDLLSDYDSKAQKYVFENQLNKKNLTKDEYENELKQYECEKKLKKDELIDKRFHDLKNELSSWNKNKEPKGYINSRLIEMSQRES